MFTLLVLGSMLALCLPFLLAQREVPTALLLAGRWLPALATIAALAICRPGGRIVDWWGLRQPGGWRRLVLGFVTAVAVAVTVAFATLGVGVLLGLVRAQLPALPVLVVTVLVSALVFTLSTLGEEVAWRSFLPRALAGWGFWGSALAIGGLWAVWHLPLHLSYVAAGVMSLPVAVTSTVALVAVAPLWQALAVRFGSVWPAAFAHAVPLTAMTLVADSMALPTGSLVAFQGVGMVLSLVAAVAVLRVWRRPI
ncbi:MAG: CPBP family glutamic-type intramembrane protease [Propionibacteriaceae bacterium]|nr:CPBP family glutamic-type intramembrane protease [Propionibacteriaceae bacterium]